MPYRRRSTVIYKKVGGRWVKKGKSRTVAMAKRYMRALYAHSKD